MNVTGEPWSEAAWYEPGGAWEIEMLIPSLPSCRHKPGSAGTIGKYTLALGDSLYYKTPSNGSSQDYIL